MIAMNALGFLTVLVCLRPLEKMAHVMPKMNVRTKEVPGMAPVLEVMAFVVSVSQSLISFFFS